MFNELKFCQQYFLMHRTSAFGPIVRTLYNIKYTNVRNIDFRISPQGGSCVWKSICEFLKKNIKYNIIKVLDIIEHRNL